MSIFCKTADKLKKVYAVLNNINNIEIRNIKFHLFLIKFSLFFLNPKNIEDNKKSPPIGKAEGKKKIPINQDTLTKLKREPRRVSA